ncbi:gp16 family protein [Insolitispirillum peregrinum]|uniref:gp16 family protein n=1 Tax=Insolitispirillum peregrinum TaxID=80876 RepID=UPI003618971B
MTPDRRAMLAKVHIAKKALSLDEETYRAVISRMSKGKATSASTLSDTGLNDLLQEFKRLGWQAQKAAPRTAAKDPLAGKVRALWIALAEAGVVRDRSEAALRGYVQRMTGTSDLRFCDAGQKGRLIESLKQWAARAGGG